MHLAGLMLTVVDLAADAVIRYADLCRALIWGARGSPVVAMMTSRASCSLSPSVLASVC